MFFPEQYKKLYASVVSGTLGKEEVYRAKIFDSLRSLWARHFYGLGYEDSLKKREIFRAKKFSRVH